MEKIEIGQILKAQGLNGEIKIKPYTDAEVFDNLTYIFLDDSDKKINVLRSVFRLGNAYLLLENIDDRTKAETLKGKQISIFKEDLCLPEDEYIIDDILNMKVFLSTGENIGEIIQVEQYGSADILTINGKLGKWQVPYISDLVESVDKSNKIMVLNAKRFEEVKV